MIRAALGKFIERSSSLTRGPWILLLGWLIAGVALAWIAGEFARRDAVGELERQARAGAALHAAVLRSELDKQRAIPIVLARPGRPSSTSSTPRV